MNWDELEAFRVVAEELSFTRAARRLEVSVTVVSQRVARMERAIGVRLFERTTRSVNLTGQGQVMLQGANRIFSQWKDTKSALDTGGVLGAPRTLRVAASEPYGADGLSAVTKLAPNVQVHGSIGDPALTLRQLDRGELDLVLAHQFPGQQLHTPVQAHMRSVVREPVSVLCSVRHELASAPSVRLEDLTKAKWLINQADTISSSWERAVLERAGALDIMPSTLLAGLHMVVNGDRIALSSPLSTLSAQESLVAVRLESPRIAAHLFMAWNPMTVDIATAESVHSIACDSYASRARLVRPYWRIISSYPDLFPGVASPMS
ncbi:LysR family transcriptional regulator [Amycolatopsis sp. NPDC004378]